MDGPWKMDSQTRKKVKTAQPSVSPMMPVPGYWSQPLSPRKGGALACTSSWRYALASLTCHGMGEEKDSRK